MATVYLTNGEERFIEDSLVKPLAFEPLKKRHLRDTIARLKAERDKFPAMTNAEKIAYAEASSPQYRARAQIIAQIDRLQLELDRWPSA